MTETERRRRMETETERLIRKLWRSDEAARYWHAMATKGVAEAWKELDKITLEEFRKSTFSL